MLSCRPKSVSGKGNLFVWTGQNVQKSRNLNAFQSIQFLEAEAKIQHPVTSRLTQSQWISSQESTTASQKHLSHSGSSLLPGTQPCSALPPPSAARCVPVPIAGIVSCTTQPPHSSTAAETALLKNANYLLPRKWLNQTSWSTRARIGKEWALQPGCETEKELSEMCNSFLCLLSFNVIGSPAPVLVTCSSTCFPLTIMTMLSDHKKQMVFSFFFFFMVLRKMDESDQSEWEWNMKPNLSSC